MRETVLRDRVYHAIDSHEVRSTIMQQYWFAGWDAAIDEAMSVLAREGLVDPDHEQVDESESEEEVVATPEEADLPGSRPDFAILISSDHASTEPETVDEEEASKALLAIHDERTTCGTDGWT